VVGRGKNDAVIKVDHRHVDLRPDTPAIVTFGPSQVWFPPRTKLILVKLRNL